MDRIKWLLSQIAFVSFFIVAINGKLDVSMSKDGYHVADVYEYLENPLSKMTDRTESSDKLVGYTGSEFLKREVLKVGSNVYVAIGFALANSIMIEGDDGIIIVDTTESTDSMQEILTEFRKITTKPVEAVIYTHFHGDHYRGTLVIVEERDKLYPNATINIYAHDTTESFIIQRIDPMFEITLKRALRQLGHLLPKFEGARTGSGLGPEFRSDSSNARYTGRPTITFSDREKFIEAGIEFELLFTPGETDDQITVWLPNEGVAMPGDNIYKTFPNLYAIRGSPARDCKQWYQSLDRTRALGAKYLVMSHTRPIVGRKEVYDTLLVYRDAIKYVNDQTIRLINKGYLPGEIVEEVQLPDKLFEHPFLQQHYGTVEWSIKGVFTNMMGWFSGDPKDLHPMSEIDRSVRLVRLLVNAQTNKACPIEVMLQEAEISHKNSHSHYISTGKHLVTEDKWALELVDSILVLDGLEDSVIETARRIKISALTALGVEEVSANGRNYYLTYAMEIEKNLSLVRSKESRAFSIKRSPIDKILELQCLKVKGLECQHENYVIVLVFTDIEKTFVVTLRNSVCDITEPVLDEVIGDVWLSTTSDVYRDIQAEYTELDEEIALGNVKVTKGSLNSYINFVKCFDPVNSL
uniref:putative alkyl/aryl-sulfatase YjcS n=1 Tax=Styela clava TaxID=7725 RepID=UPI0019395231|nr:putative alkyl/aryl-sulfatase YjcS [Styela clava]